jgi:hypothetical protein
MANGYGFAISHSHRNAEKIFAFDNEDEEIIVDVDGALTYPDGDFVYDRTGSVVIEPSDDDDDLSIQYKRFEGRSSA